MRVVGVHGYLARGAVFDPMLTRVAERTACSGVAFSYGPAAPFERVAESLREFVVDAAQGAGVVLVGHSLGGLFVRDLVERSRPPVDVRAVVLVGAPNAGTASASLAFGGARDALRRGSPLLTRLEATRSAARDIPYVAVVARDDWIVVPARSAAAVDEAFVVWLDDVGHNELLFDRRVHDVVADVVAGVARGR